MDWTDEHEAEFERRIQPIVELQREWRDNYFSAFAKRLNRAIGKARQV